VDVAKGNMDIALAKQEQDEVAVSKTTIRAPFGGIVGLRLISPGAYVKAGEDIVRLDNVSSLKLDFRVPEIYVSKLKPGLKVGIRTEAFPNDVFEGKIFAIEPTVDEKSRTVLARAHVPNSNVKLKPGMFGRVSILLESRPNAVIVPEEAIWPQGKDVFVYKVVDGKAVLTKVTLGVRRPGEVEVLEGLAENDVVITDGQMKMKDGAPVTVLPRPAAAAAVPEQARKGG
ncbi:MAG: efflux RND transporter periplasmic adaptor subunit, partial [Betaproteobacteria bacterium]